MKSQIIEQIGQTDILLPALIGEGLRANDQVKARLSVLQAAARHAQEPSLARFDLAGECRNAGLDSTAMEKLVSGASRAAGELVAAPGLDALLTAIWDDVAIMIRAVGAGNAPVGEAAGARLAAIRTAVKAGAPDTLAREQIARLTAISGGAADSLHRLVMDLHKALNELAAAQAEEVVAAGTLLVFEARDRQAVEAFMRGVESTRKLKFDHPGLATMVTRAGERLTIQNDIGETEAHVVVIAVEPGAVTVTYTDVHFARAKFFAALLRDFPVDWSGLDRKMATGFGDDGAFYLVTGHSAVADNARRDALLEAIGASLVFLIDWNRARKILRSWVANADAVAVLDWAARNRFGHRAFLELGGSELVASAVHNATPTRIGFGERLDHALGRGAALDFLKTVLRVSAEALLEGGSIRLARDRIEADLVRHLQGIDGTLMAVVVRQAGLAREIAAAVAHFVAAMQSQKPADRTALAATARRIEEKADKSAIEARKEIARFNAGATIERLVNAAEETIDELEQAAFIGSLAPGEIAADLLTPLAGLCSAAVSAAEAAASGAAAAADVPDGHRIDSEDALAAIGRLVAAEHAADGSERELTAILLRGDFDLKTALSMLELARALERATDRMARFGHVLHQHVLADLSA
jgi:uncharacterized protein Yka (UPF0111/DUF47 family)